jgi:nucleotide-binding universal stress UspA family protein
MFKVIIWATDGSRGAQQALPFARGLARGQGARLIVVHINEMAVSRAAGPVNFNEDEVQAAVRKHVEDLRQEGLDVTLQLADVMGGGAAAAIVKIADKEKADVIVVGTRGFGPLVGLLVGSVTHRLLHIMHCPILVVPSTPADGSTS